MSTDRSTLFQPATSELPPRVLLVAEIGVNHDGDAQRAADMVTAAAAAGADAVKFQLFDPAHLLSNQALLAQYQIQAGMPDPVTMLNKLKLSVRDMQGLRAQAREHGVKFIVTPFSLPEVAALAQLDVDAVKIASPDAVNPPLLRAAAALGKPLLISTGTCAPEELTFAADLLRAHAPGGALMQCVSSYPTPPEQAALGAIPDLVQRFHLPVGYSDHTTELTTGGLAVAAGACVIEKHFTLDCHAPGPDHAASLDPVRFAHYVELTQQAADMFGPLCKRVLDVERDVRSVSRQSLCATRDLPAGHVLTAADLTVKRPGTGIPALKFDTLLQRRLRRSVRANDLLDEADLA